MKNNRNPRRRGRGRTKTGGVNVLNNSTPIYAGGKVVGRVENKTFCKTIIGSKHLLRIPPAIAFDVTSLEAAESAGAQMVWVKDVETASVYETTISKIKEKGIRLNRGYGDQVALPLKNWNE